MEIYQRPSSGWATSSSPMTLTGLYPQAQFGGFGVTYDKSDDGDLWSAAIKSYITDDEATTDVDEEAAGPAPSGRSPANPIGVSRHPTRQNPPRPPAGRILVPPLRRPRKTKPLVF